jgi:hypothetical protein
VLTRRPTNHDSGAGQYSVIVASRIHVPRARLDGGGGTLGLGVGAGARPPIGTPPLPPGLPAFHNPARSVAARALGTAPSTATATSSGTPTALAAMRAMTVRDVAELN